MEHLWQNARDHPSRRHLARCSEGLLRYVGVLGDVKAVEGKKLSERDPAVLVSSS
jgi:hypothetical protein